MKLNDFILFKQKISFNTQNLVKAWLNIKKSFNTKKSLLSRVYSWEINEISWILTNYHLKTKNSLKNDDMRNIIQALFKLIEAEFKKSWSHSLNNA